MTKCVKCGGDITEGAKFCAGCGTPVESGTTKDETKERTQVFVGTIRKCPNCGEQIGTNTTKCPACGFVIEKRNVSASLDDFVKKLASFDHYAKKREYIENYPVPNNKEDIRDLLTYAASQRDKDYDDNVAKAYWVDAWNNKCRQIVNQAFDTFGMDEDFASWLRNYKAGVEKSSTENEKLKKKLRSIEKGKKRAAGAKKFFKGFGIIVVILALLGGAGYGIRSYAVKRAAEKQKLVEKAELEKAELEKLKTETAELVSKGFVIPKENVSLGGLLSTYCEVTGDAKVSYKFRENNYEDLKGKSLIRFFLDASISVPVRLKKDFFSSHKKQYDNFIKETFTSTDRNISDYRIETSEDVGDSLITGGYTRPTLNTLLGASVGDNFELVDSGWICYYTINQKSKTSETISIYNKIKDKVKNPSKTVSLKLNAHFYSGLNKFSDKKGYDSRTVEIY